MEKIDEVWVFNGANSRFASAIFRTKETAEAWIKKNKLSDVLTLYPLDQSVYDWAIAKRVFRPKSAP